MLKSTHSSQAHPTFRSPMARVLRSINTRLKRNIVPLGLSALAAIAITQTGCSSRLQSLGSDLSNNLLVDYRDAVWSRRAYNLRYGNCDRPFSNHYRDGFCAGYQDICNGGDGYVPALPPSEYRGYEYQSAEGANCVNTWFEGYPAGVAAAKQDRSGDFKDMFISKMINSAVTQDNAKHMLPGDVPIIKPKGSASSDNSLANPTRQAPPAPDVAMGNPIQPTSNASTGLALAGPADTNPLTMPGNISIMEPAATTTQPTDGMRPALPPIVRTTSATTPAESSPTNGASQPVRQAAVINNQFIR